jgi:hypothetical protein
VAKSSNLVQQPKKNKKSVKENGDLPGKEGNLILKKRLKYILVVILILSFYMSLYYGGWSSGDFIIHLPKVRQILELPKITYGDFFIKDLDRSNRAHNILHPLLAMISRISHTDPIKVWALCISIFVTVSLLAFFAATRVIFKDEIFAYLATFIWFLWWGIFNTNFGTRHTFWILGGVFPCPSQFVNIFSPVILFFVFKFIYTSRNRYLYILPFLGVCFALIHMLAFLYMLFAVGAFFVFSIFFKNSVQNLTKKLLLCILFLSLPGFIYTFYMQKQLNKPLVNPAYKSISGEVNPGWNPVVFLRDKYPIIDPFKGLWPGFLEKVAFVSVPFLIFYFKKYVWAAYLFSIPISISLILLNPLLLYILQPIHPPMQAYYGLVAVIPYYWLFSMFIYSGVKFIKKKYGNQILYFVVIILLLVLGKYAVSGISYLKKIPFTTKRTFEMVENNAHFVKQINKIIPPGSVVLMDEDKIWFWPVFFPHFMITHPNRGLLAPNFDPAPRKEGLKRLLENPLDETSFNYLDKYNVDFLVIDRKYLSNKDFSKYKDKLKEVLETGSFNIYQYLR